MRPIKRQLMSPSRTAIAASFDYRPSSLAPSLIPGLPVTLLPSSRILILCFDCDACRAATDEGSECDAAEVQCLCMQQVSCEDSPPLAPLLSSSSSSPFECIASHRKKGNQKHTKKQQSFLGHLQFDFKSAFHTSRVMISLWFFAQPEKYVAMLLKSHLG